MHENFGYDTYFSILIFWAGKPNQKVGPLRGRFGSIGISKSCILGFKSPFSLKLHKIMKRHLLSNDEAFSGLLLTWKLSHILILILRLLSFLISDFSLKDTGLPPKITFTFKCFLSLFSAASRINCEDFPKVERYSENLNS